MPNLAGGTARCRTQSVAKAARAIHSALEGAAVGAEVVTAAGLLEHAKCVGVEEGGKGEGSEKAPRAANASREEGVESVVEDGDVLHIRTQSPQKSGR